MISYNSICPGGGPECKQRFFDPTGDHHWIDVKRCPTCDDGIRNPELRPAKKAYANNELWRKQRKVRR